ncbi:methionine--tRNA ligase [Mycoplasma sp. Mirounga ES2805-ORL]|uniref:methionine--tRNA ligase n=1 Tax=Mycoplasma sp. Mirounga ES2805-ORL TaxID=754514 RepID=UPI00197C174B|nr:methionine--tRNA ligase [Mycoplasma sp. Mirounga ES2805-ORL]QSF13437.1 methionine--tRNA ligase [Mycoplasma sp. Mirounga ES2805-ORL]
MSKQKKTFYITTPIYYTSGPLHIGHLYCTTMAWTIANYKRIMGYDVKFLTGSDEHGQKIENKAQKQNKYPKEFVDELVSSYKQMWKDWGIEFDYFSRTTNKYHEATVQKVFSYFLKQGLIYKSKYEGLYSIEDEEFLTKNQAIFKDNEYFHPSSGHKLINMAEESYFFKTSQFANWWLEYSQNHPEFLEPIKSVNEMKNNFIKEGLEDLSVTRTNVKWAIPTLDDPKHTLYVWMDALFNYITALGFDLDNPKEDYLKYWKEGDEIVHILGKEIARFHFIYWPIFINALGIKQPTKIYSHGLLRDDIGRKMSKSLNNVISPNDLIKSFDPEMVKYYFASQIIFGEDGNFSEQKLKEVVNADLVNNYGNLISRTLKMISTSFKSGLVYKKSNDNIHIEIENSIKEMPLNFIKFMNDYKIDKAFHEVIELGNKLNKYIDETKPWTKKDNLEELENILVRLLNGIYAVSWAMQISLPSRIKEVAKALRMSGFELNQISNFDKFNKLVTSETFMLFERLK